MYGEFYELRDSAVIILYENDMLEKDLRGYGGALSLDSSMRTLLDHRILKERREIPTAWSQQMLLGLFLYAKDWYLNGTQQQPPIEVDLTHRSIQNAPTNVRLQLNLGYEYPKFDGYYQFQHWEITLCYRKAGNIPKDAQSRRFCLRTLSENFNAGTKPSPIDLEIEHVRFRKLKLELVQLDDLAEMEPDALSTHLDSLAICYNIEDQDRLDVVDDDDTLASALVAMKKPNEWRYTLYAFPEQKVCYIQLF